MRAQVRGHALLGRMNKTEAHLVPCQRCGCSQGIGGCVEQWVEPAGCSIQLVQSRLTPRQMIGFLLVRRSTGFAACRRRGLLEPALDRALGADLAGVIHSHQPRRMCRSRGLNWGSSCPIAGRAVGLLKALPRMRLLNCPSRRSNRLSSWSKPPSVRGLDVVRSVMAQV